MSVTVSQPQNIRTIDGNGFAVYKDSQTNKFMVKDVNGQTEELLTSGSLPSNVAYTDVNNNFSVGQTFQQGIISDNGASITGLTETDRVRASNNLEVGLTNNLDPTNTGIVAIGQNNTINSDYSVAIGDGNEINEDARTGHLAVGFQNRINDIPALNPSYGNFAIGENNTISGSVGVIGKSNTFELTTGGVSKKAIIIGNANSATNNFIGSVIIGNDLNLGFGLGSNNVAIGGTGRTSFYATGTNEIVRFTTDEIRIRKGVSISDTVSVPTNVPVGSLVVGEAPTVQQMDSDSINSIIVGTSNDMMNAKSSGCFGDGNLINGGGQVTPVRSHLIGYDNNLISSSSSFIAGGQNNVYTTTNGFALGYSNELRGDKSIFAFGENNTSPSDDTSRNIFMIGGQLIGRDKTMNLGFRNETAEYPTANRNQGLGDVTFAISVGLNTTANSNAVLITEGGINGGSLGTVPQIPRVILPTIVGFQFANDTDAGAGGIPVGGLYHNSGVLKIRRF